MDNGATKTVAARDGRTLAYLGCRGIEDLSREVAVPAIEHAGLEPEDIDAIFIGLFNNGFLKQDFPSSLVMQVEPRLRYKPATRLENACATGSMPTRSTCRPRCARRALLTRTTRS